MNRSDHSSQSSPMREAGSAGGVTRGRFLQTATTASLLASATALPSCSSSAIPYRQAAEQTWRPFSEAPMTQRSALQRELVRYATLAPSSHNTQCWKFALESRRISIVPDFARRCPAVDPDDHHVFVSLGCATENLVIAAAAHGLRGTATFDPTDRTAVRVDFEPARPVISPLFRAIPRRQCTRTAYDGKPLSTTELRQLERAGTGDGVHVLVLTAHNDIERVLQYVVEGNTRQMDDAAFMDELKSWIRFSDREAVAMRDGLFSRASGNPSVPRWFAGPLFKLLFTPKGENDRYRNVIRSSAGIAVFVSESSDRHHWVQTGRAYERFVLQATAMDVRTAMLNQPVEVAAIRPQFARSLGFGDTRPDLVVRFGRGGEMPRSLRRPIDAVIVA